MEHGLELIIPRLEIFGNWILNIFSYPGNIGNWIFLISWYPRDFGDWIFLVFWYPRDIGYWILLFSHILEIRAAGGRLQGLCCAALDYFWNMFPGISGYPGNIENIIFYIFWDFYKKGARRNFTQNRGGPTQRSLI